MADTNDVIFNPEFRRIVEERLGISLDGMSYDDLMDLINEQKEDRDSIMIMDINSGHCYGVDMTDKSVFVSYGSLEIEGYFQTRGMVIGNENGESEEYIPWIQGSGIDLTASGRRWEGNEKDGKPCGYGVLYDEDGNRVFEGFMMNGLKTGYGREYYNDIGALLYDGCYCYDMKCGYGTLYNRDGSIVRKGMWKNDHRYSYSFDGVTLDDYSEMIYIPDSSLNTIESLNISSCMDAVEWLFIADDCCGSVRSFVIDGLSNLRTITIGTKSFTTNRNERRIVRRGLNDGTFRVVNCFSLCSIEIFEMSFCDYSFCELVNLPSLRSITMGRNCFFYALSFSLTGMLMHISILYRSSTTRVR